MAAAKTLAKVKATHDRERAKKEVRGGHLKQSESKDGRELDSLSARIKTLDQLLAAAEVDLEQWEVERLVANKWEMGAKLDDGRIAVEPLFQIKAWLRRKRGWTPTEFRDQIIADMRRAAPPPRPLPKQKTKSGDLLYEISIFDPHIGKLAWHRETGHNYDLKIAEAEYMHAVETLLAHAEAMQLGKILFVVGNDFLHTDNARNETHAGTRQDADGRWQRSFLHARRLAATAIDRCREVAPVDALIVPGNHDRERLFYLGEALECQFGKDTRVNVNNAPTLRKYYSHGVNLIGFTHGSEEKHQDLPLLMADEVPDMWAASKFREWHVGHIHTRRMMQWMSTKSYGLTAVRILASISGTDAWHKSKGYRALRGSEAYLWDFEKGYLGHFYSPVKE